MTFTKLLFRSIKMSLGRFFSIVCIVALGSGFLSGILSATPDMKEAVDIYYNHTNTYDFALHSTIGFRRTNLEKLLTQDYISKGDIVYEVDNFITDEKNNKKYEARITHLDIDHINVNKPVLKEGRLPKNENECFACISGFENGKITVGDTLLDGNRSYRIVGTGILPQYSSVNGEHTVIGDGKIKIGLYVPLSDEEFDKDLYTSMYLVGDNDFSRFSKEYDDYVNDYGDLAKSVAKYEISEKEKSIASDVKYNISSTFIALSRKKSEAEDGIKKNTYILNNLKNSLKNASLSLDNAIINIEDSIKLKNRGVNPDSGYTSIDVANSVESRNYSRLHSVMKKYDFITGNPQNILQYSQSLNNFNNYTYKRITNIQPYPKIDKTLKQYLDSENKKADIDAINEYLDKYLVKNVTSAYKSMSLIANDNLNVNSIYGNLILDQAKSTLKNYEEKRLAILNNVNSLNREKSILIGEKNNVNDAIKKLEKSISIMNYAEKKIDTEAINADERIKTSFNGSNNTSVGKVYLQKFTDNASFNAFKKDVEKVASIAKVFPLFFFLVAILVVSTTITRVIEDDRSQIGTLKSLGYFNADIREYYVRYGIYATIIGGIVGELVGFTILPLAISNSYKSLYHMPMSRISIRPEIGITVLAATILCVIVTIRKTCDSQMKENPALLMLPKAPLPGKKIFLERIPFIWKKISFSKKVTLRNLFRYKKRFFMTILGISGSMALLVTGFGIRDSIQNIGNMQFKSIDKYDLFISTKSKYKDKINIQFKNSPLKSSMSIMEDDINVKNGSVNLKASIIVPESDTELKKFIDLRDYRTGKPISIPPYGAVISQKLSEKLNVRKGSYIYISSGNSIIKIKVSDIAKNYIGNRVYMSKYSFEYYFKKDVKFNSILANTDKSKKHYLEDIASNKDVNYAFDVDSMLKSFEKSMRSLNYIIFVVIISASLLTVIVLYNLININICERKKELATIEVLGFFKKEVYSYIFREIHILVLIGSAIGIPLGILLHRFVLFNIEGTDTMFGRSINYNSYIYSFLIIAIFVYIVELFMKKVINNIHMAEAMKSD